MKKLPIVLMTCVSAMATAGSLDRYCDSASPQHPQLSEYFKKLAKAGVKGAKAMAEETALTPENGKPGSYGYLKRLCREKETPGQFFDAFGPECKNECNQITSSSVEARGENYRADQAFQLCVAGCVSLEDRMRAAEIERVACATTNAGSAAGTGSVGKTKGLADPAKKVQGRDDGAGRSDGSGRAEGFDPGSVR